MTRVTDRMFITEVTDRFIRENFLRIKNAFRTDPFRKGSFKFFEFNFSAASTLTVPHSLGFLPLDVIQLSVRDTDSATITWHYDDFTSSEIKLQSSAATTVRAYVGTYREE